jgi:hypothetical protein
MSYSEGPAAPQLRQLVAAFSPRRPKLIPRLAHASFDLSEVAGGQDFSSSFPCQLSFPHRSILIYHLGLLYEAHLGLSRPTLNTISNNTLRDGHELQDNVPSKLRA